MRVSHECSDLKGRSHVQPERSPAFQTELARRGFDGSHLRDPRPSRGSVLRRGIARILWPPRDSASAAIHLGFWDGGTRDHREAAINANRVLASKVALRPGERVLDAGCGAGGSAVWLARELGARAVGVNLSPSQIHRARRLAHAQGVSDRVSFERQDFAATTFPDESFDVVWAQESICHVEDKEPFLLEAVRLLKPGGRIVVADRLRSARTRSAPKRSSCSSIGCPGGRCQTCPRPGSS
jgi:SAM-dependent methyltransferase